MVSKIADVKIRAGQRVRLETPGGGGWGEPTARDPRAVARDVRLGFIGVEAAARDYAVVVSPTGLVDEHATAALRPGAAA
jgi:N-methylhydantoinase B